MPRCGGGRESSTIDSLPPRPAPRRIRWLPHGAVPSPGALALSGVCRSYLQHLRCRHPAPVPSRRRAPGVLPKLLSGATALLSFVQPHLIAAPSREVLRESARAAEARALLERESWREALAAARALANAAPHDPEAIGVLGEALYRAGRIDEAGRTLAPLVGAGAANARALLTLGLVRNAEGNDEEASTLVERAVEADPGDRRVAFWASTAAASGARARELLEAYLARSEGDDIDRVRAAQDSLRFLRALSGRAVWIPVATPERIAIPLRAMGSGGRVRGYVLEVDLGKGKPVRLLLDTGSSGVFLLARVAERHGFAPLAESTTFGGGGDQRHETRRGILPRFSVGGLVFKDALVTTTEEEIEPTGQFHGVLGIQLLEGYRVTLDLARGRLLLDVSPSEPSGEPYWEVSGQLLLGSGARLGPQGLFVLDTGAARTLVSAGYAADVPGAILGKGAPVRGYGGRLESARSVRGIVLGFQGAEVPAEVAADLALQSRLSGVEVSGFLGLDLLSSARVVVDTRSRRIRLDRRASR